MRHSRGAFLLGAEVFFCFSHFRSLEVTDFQGHLGEDAGNDAQGGYVFCMMVALYYLGGNDFRFQAQFFAYVFFYEGIDVCIGAYGAGEFAYGHFVSGPFHAVDVPEGFGVPEEEFQSKGGGFCMNAMGSADGGGMFEFYSSSLQYFCQFFQVVDEDFGGLFELYVEAGVLHVGGGEAHVDVLGFVAYVFTYVGEEGDNVVVDFAVNFMDAVYVKVCFGFDHFHCFLRNAAQFSICFAGSDFHIQHGLPFISFVPDLFHDRTCVPWYHLSDFSLRFPNAGADFAAHHYTGGGGLCQAPGDAGSITNSEEVGDLRFQLV